MYPRISLVETQPNCTLREEDGHGLAQNVVEAADDEHLFGGDDVVLQHERQNRAE